AKASIVLTSPSSAWRPQLRGVQVGVLSHSSTQKGGTLMNRARLRVPIGLLLMAVLLAVTSCQPQQAGSTAQGTSVPRNRTLVMTPWSDTTGPLKNPENWNIYLTGNSNLRVVGLETVFEALMYTNLNTGELIPWQAESFEYNKEFTD